MPLLYKALQSSLPSKDGKKKWHPRLVKFRKVVDTQKVGEMIADKSSLTAGDVHNVIRNLVAVMSDLLLNSRTVKLDGLGTFTVIAKANGNGVDASEEVNPNQINHLRIKFTPSATRNSGGTTRAMFNGVEYERWEGRSANMVADGDDGSGDGGDVIDPGF
ncbi:HU family DNA-binding protein [Bacteroides sp. 51]|uniref:HU family DNA-binding protein n=1 Tax=Bacteroides sp. 51 TaxID=2302938 RepID=UPI0013D6B89D|nr:HU family DNA-binding protein [Bacteroides sp. 51]NDV83355.1 DNA-binding protein [Bacteroides sp. 51]